MHLRWLVALPLFASPQLVPQAARQREPMQVEQTAAQILERLGKVYAGCQSYRDSGVVTTVFFEHDRKRTVRKPFTTAFVRPDRFRYEFQARRGEGEDEFDRYLVWRSGQDVRTWWDIQPGVETHRSLSRALAGPMGVSGKSAHNVPAMLMPKDMGANLSLLEDAERVEDGDIDGTQCYRIQRFRGVDHLTLWIEKTSSLLRRIEEFKQHPGFHTESTTDYEPELDVPVPPELLQFDPPRHENR